MMVLVLGVSTTTMGLPANLGFELGNLTGWGIYGMDSHNPINASAVSSYTAPVGNKGMTYLPKDGNYFLVVEFQESFMPESIIFDSDRFPMKNSEVINGWCAFGSDSSGGGFLTIQSESSAFDQILWGGYI